MFQGFDYYPFGMLIQERSYHDPSQDYRYGFQGQEKDDEIKGEGNSINYTFRMHDPRVGRFFAVDPLEKKYPWYSPYQFSGNRVVDAVELEGLEPAKINDETKNLVIIVQGFGGNPPKGKTQCDNAGGRLIRDEALGQISSTGPTLQVVHFASSDNNVTKNDVETTIREFKKTQKNGQVILIGHSGGADNLIEFAKENTDLGVDLLITLDARDPKQSGWTDTNIPSNVKNAINYYQNTDPLNFISDRTMDFSDKTNGTNVLSPGSNHRSIDNNQWQNIISDINNQLKDRDAVKKASEREQKQNKPDKENGEYNVISD